MRAWPFEGSLTNTVDDPRVELLFWAGCPSHPRALADLRAALAETGGDPDAVVVREVRPEEQAAAEGFVGSPTIRVDGADVVPPGPDEPPAPGLPRLPPPRRAPVARPGSPTTCATRWPRRGSAP